jgi:proteasome lid subunit RPN8/RPN11
MAYSDKFEGYMMGCGWDNNQWFLASDLLLNNIVEDQIRQIGSFTQETKKEFGAIVLRTSRGVMLDMHQIGEDHSIELEVTRKLESDEEVLGTVHCHPTVPVYSSWDLASFLRDSWEKVSMLVGSDEKVFVSVKTPETITISKEEFLSTIKKWELEGLTAEQIADSYHFLLYEGSSSNLKLVCGEEAPTTLEKLISRVKGTKGI